MSTTSSNRRGPPDDAPSVSELTARVKEQLEGRFADVWVVGEISNLSRAASGHLYLSLKDDEAVLRAVVWRSTVATLALEPCDGLEVVCHGRIEVYAPRGTYQLTIDRLHAVGAGALEARLRRLHAQLEREGLFAPERKRPIPVCPRRIALVTSPSGAAIADFLRTLAGRWRGSHVVVVPARVQGAGAAEEMATALGIAGRLRPAVDVIALVRGGGSLEDLWAFNEEVLVRAVAASPVPIVTGVGHEIDLSLADLAADLRALTPTDAAVRVSPDGRQLTAAVQDLGTRLHEGLERRLARARELLTRLARSRIFSAPRRLVDDPRALVTQQAGRLQRLAVVALDRGRERLAAAAGRLEAASPLQRLARGWSLTFLAEDPSRCPTGAVPLRSVVGLRPGAMLVTQLADGRLGSRLERIAPDVPST
jgi:exodeoxyribonuclease VII large subunit